MVVVSGSRKIGESLHHLPRADDLDQGNGAVLLHGPEINIQGHQVTHLLDKVIIRLVVHVVNIDLDDRCKAFISLWFLSMKILDPT
jgi:hypothetical protein